MKFGILIALIIFLLNPELAYARCKIRDIVYTEGNYDLHFDRRQISATLYDFTITETKTGISFPGSISWSNGYSVPGISIKIPCRDGEKAKPEGFCGYGGILYEIKGKQTTYAFQSNYDEYNPILFPDLNRKFYYKRTGRSQGETKTLPADVWVFKECLESPE